MEERAPYHTPAPRGPRNLVPHVAQWLRGLDFTALEADHGAIATVQAHWDSPEGHRFYFYYEWSALKALVSLSLTCAGECLPLDLIKGQHVGHLREARRLLHDDERFRAAWLAAKGRLVPTASTP
jgi:hypothetical protein